jgi:hypothetical protein
VSQSATHHFHVANLVAPAVDSAVRAVSDRGNQTEAQRAAKAHDAETLIMSFLPRDGIELILAGQVVMFNELLADGARDVLRGMIDTQKQRSLSTLVALGRVALGHVDRLDKRGIQPHRTELPAPQAGLTAPQAEPRATPATEAPAPEPAKNPLAAARVPAVKPVSPPATTNPPPPTAPTPRTVTTEPETPETSWLDAPYQEWRVETQAGDAQLAATLAPREEPAQARAAAKGNDPFSARPAMLLMEAALPHQPAGYSPARALAGATAGD